MFAIILAIAIATTDRPPVVDEIEQNTIYRLDDAGEYVPATHQIILWRWTGGERHVAEWHMPRDFRTESGRAYWTHCGRIYRCRFKTHSETHTLRDPERDDAIQFEPRHRTPYFR